MRSYTINPDSDIPIYRQLVDQINAEIRSGALKTGTQLPTVREMAEQMHLSCGTVKRVYDRLTELGDIEMTRRRGTFVKYVHQTEDNRKVVAMTAIDQMIRKLTELRFSPSEIQIFLNLKMREWGLKWSGITVAVVCDYPELESAVEEQVKALGNVQVLVCSTEQLREYPYSVDEQADVILADQEVCTELGAILPDPEKLLKVAMCPRQETMLAIAAVTGKKTGVMYRTELFAQLVFSCIPWNAHADVSMFPEGAAVPENLEAVILAPDSRNPFAEDVDEVRFQYGIDAGSMIYLEERIARIREEKQLRPGKMVFG